MKLSLSIVIAGLALLSFSTSAFGSTLFGSLSNFDVVNDTGVITRGFEIELEGVSSTDIAFTFGNPYIRYGDPVIEATGTGTIVRYASAFTGSGWAVGTPVPAGPFPTGGHQAFYPAYGGDANYETLGGEHFGIALNGNPTNTIYRWLLGDDAGNLSAAGSNVKIPAPIWNVQAPVNPAAPAAVQVVLPALPKEHPTDLFGEAMWVKVFVTEAGDPIELNHLLPGDPGVPDGSEPAEVEVEWQLLQDGKDSLSEVDSGLADLKLNSESITRRYEFYKYTGTFDVDGEALIEDAAANPSAVGDFIGAQNAALNIAPFAVPEPRTLVLLSLAFCGFAAWGRRKG
ncbi:MAG: PEP-CTERM sorting domain-containing protein [Chthoniobacterales bacterium]